MHCIQQTGLQLSQVQMVVYDECDRLFEMGFAEQLKEITARMPNNRQSLLFSATISSEVKDFTLAGIKDYRMVQVDRDSKLSDQLKIHFFVVRSVEKEAALMYILRERVQTGEQTIVFAATRYHVEYLCELAIKAGFKANFIYGAMDQRAREDKLIEFRRKYTNFLFVTDLAARGIDIPYLENVIHFDFPTKLKLFIHRAGRTARAGRTGVSYGIVT
jgi:ATP-dependent RNA helicase DDX54/DBP10